jgi:hypothetical protein
VMRRRALFAVLAWVGLTSAAAAQLVPLSQCGSALPCSIPVGLRPADAAAVSPYGRIGNSNTLVGIEVLGGEGLKPELVTRSIASDPSDLAARIFVKNNPSFAMKPTPKPAGPQTAAPSPEKRPAKAPDARVPTPSS